MPWYSTLKTTISFGGCPIALLGISNICVTSTPTIAGKVPYFVTLVAPLGARAIVLKMALGAFGQRSPIRLPFACPHIVDLGDIFPFEGLLLVTMVWIYQKSQANSQKQANTDTGIRRVQKKAKESKPKPEKSSLSHVINGRSTKKHGFCTRSSHRTSTNVTSWIASLAIHVNPKDDQTATNQSQMIGKMEGGD
ncbi:hypothetical protein Tco_1567718 [Tanacetum coccineum]